MGCPRDWRASRSGAPVSQPYSYFGSHSFTDAFVRQRKYLGKPVDLSDQRIDRAVRLVMWLGDQLAWWWVIIVLLAVLGAFVLNSELWDVLSRTLPFSRARVDTGLSREFRR
jgi:hypothetical protein